MKGLTGRIQYKIKEEEKETGALYQNNLKGRIQDKEEEEIFSKTESLYQNHFKVESIKLKEKPIAFNEDNLKTLDDEISSMVGHSGAGTQERICKICGKVGKVKIALHIM